MLCGKRLPKDGGGPRSAGMAFFYEVLEGDCKMAWFHKGCFADFYNCTTGLMSPTVQKWLGTLEMPDGTLVLERAGFVRSADQPPVMVIV